MGKVVLWVASIAALLLAIVRYLSNASDIFELPNFIRWVIEMPIFKALDAYVAVGLGLTAICIVVLAVKSKWWLQASEWYARSLRVGQIDATDPLSVYRLMNDSALRVAATSLATQLRTLEAKSKAKERAGRPRPEGVTDSAWWDLRQAYDQELSSELDVTYQSRYASRVRAMRDELLKRLGEEPVVRYAYDHEFYNGTIDHASLAGPRPLADAALVLERLLVKLP